jgi:cyclic pyranopterin monophosphate synthase
MVDVSEKKPTHRKAVAHAQIVLPHAINTLFDGKEINTPKGAVIQTATIAGIMAAKKTGELIPLCHPLALENVHIDITLEQDVMSITGTVATTGKTGVEMEALTAVSVAALTVYDMCKALSHDIILKEIKLIEKTGGKNDFRRKA